MLGIDGKKRCRWNEERVAVVKEVCFFRHVALTSFGNALAVPAICVLYRNSRTVIIVAVDWNLVIRIAADVS